MKAWVCSANYFAYLVSSKVGFSTPKTDGPDRWRQRKSLSTPIVSSLDIFKTSSSVGLAWNFDLLTEAWFSFMIYQQSAYGICAHLMTLPSLDQISKASSRYSWLVCEAKITLELAAEGRIHDFVGVGHSWVLSIPIYSFTKIQSCSKLLPNQGRIRAGSSCKVGLERSVDPDQRTAVTSLLEVVPV